MNAPTRLGLYGLLLVAVFAMAAVTANVVASEETVQGRTQERDEEDRPQGEEPRAEGAWGPRTVFEATAPVPGDDPSYLDLQVDGRVYGDLLVLDVTEEHEEGAES